MVGRSAIFFALCAGLSASVAAIGATAWMGPPYTLTLNHVTGPNQAVTGNLDIVLQHDTECDVTVHPLRAGGEVLTGPGGATLVTSYMLTGNALLTPDGAWVASGDFKNKSYHVKTAGPTSDTLRLSVKGETPVGSAMPAGDYTTSFALRVTW